MEETPSALRLPLYSVARNIMPRYSKSRVNGSLLEYVISVRSMMVVVYKSIWIVSGA